MMEPQRQVPVIPLHTPDAANPMTRAGAALRRVADRSAPATARTAASAILRVAALRRVAAAAAAARAARAERRGRAGLGPVQV